MSKRKTSPFIEGFFPSKQYREDDSSNFQRENSDSENEFVEISEPDSSNSQRENPDSENEFVEMSESDSSNSQTETSEPEESDPEVCID